MQPDSVDCFVDVAFALPSIAVAPAPLELFGVQESTLIEIIANAPAKVTAFISTIIEKTH